MRMRNVTPVILLVFGVVCGYLYLSDSTVESEETEARLERGVRSTSKPTGGQPGDRDGEEEEGKRYPNSTFYEQRAYPYSTIPNERYVRALREAQALSRSMKPSSAAESWVLAGPTNVPGRITAIGVHPSDLNTIYAGTAAGGVFKTVDHGATWGPIFDQIGTYSIGAIAVNPTNPSIVYVGTGEASSAIDDYEGNGVYKSIDGGATWTHVGLDSVALIGKIVIDPLRPETVFVAGLGRVFGRTTFANQTVNRGLYRSLNGGATWTKILYEDVVTGCIDVALCNNTVLATMWSVDGNTTDAAYLSTDNGDSFALLSGTSTLPSAGSGIDRIGVSIDPITQTYWIVHVADSGYFHSVYRSRDGVNWTQVDNGSLTYSFSNFGWYFGQIRAVPGDSLSAYVLGQTLWKTTNGGLSWSDVTSTTHADHHDMVIIPQGSGYFLYNGCDGGVNYSDDMASSWTTYFNMPNTQFYAMAIDPSNPDHLLGGAQDNGTNRTLTGSVGGWDHILGGDGFYVVVDYANPNIIYAEFQNGYLMKSIDGGFSFFAINSGIDGTQVRAWNTPIVMDPIHSNILYTSTDRVYRTIDGGNFWQSISPDLTLGYLTTIGVSAADSQVVYAGSTRGVIQVTKNGGASWTIVDWDLPDRWVTRLTPSPTDAASCYATLSGYLRDAVTSPHVFRTKDYGATWTDISSDLPQAPVNDIIIDPSDSMTLYVATDVGVYVSDNQGGHWGLLAAGMPITCVVDIQMDPGSRKLVAATHGRSMYAITIPPTSCCSGTTGNVNMTGIVDLADLSALVSYLTGGGFILPCQPEANVNNVGIVDLADLSSLVSYLTGGGFVLPGCTL